MHLLWAKKILRNIIHSHSNFASIYHAQWRKLYAEQYLPEFIDCQIFFLLFLHEIVLNTKQFFYCVFFGLLNGGVWYMFVSFSFFLLSWCWGIDIDFVYIFLLLFYVMWFVYWGKEFEWIFNFTNWNLFIFKLNFRGKFNFLF